MGSCGETKRFLNRYPIENGDSRGGEMRTLHRMRRALVRIKMRYALLRVLAVNQSALD